MAEEIKTDKSSAPPCGLYHRIPEDPDMEEWQPRILALRFVINKDTRYARNMNVIECVLPEDAKQDAIEKASAFVQVAQLSGFVAILRGPLKFAKMLDADGVLTATIEELIAAKKELSDDKITGLACGFDKDLAKAALDNQADYVTFGNPVALPEAALIAWWSTLTDKPCAVIGPATASTAGLYAATGATFIDITDYLVKHPKGPMQATVNMLHEINEAVVGNKPN